MEKTARQARRKPWNEASLMWSVGGAVVCLIVYYVMMTGQYWFNPLGLNILGNAILHGVVIGGLLALGWYSATKGRVQRAREAYAGLLHAAGAERMAETKRKIAEMKAGETAQ